MSIQSINARNQFRGKIKEIILGPVVSEVDVDTPAGIVTSVITTRSVKELDLQVGTEVLAFVKATEVSVAALTRGPQPCSGFMRQPRHAAPRAGAGRRLLRPSNSRRGLFQTLRRRFLSCRYAKMSGTGIGARSPCRTLKLNPMHFVRCALFGAGMALSAAAASAPSSS